MTYNLFKEEIENTNLSSEEFYKYIITKDSISNIDTLYRQYIKENVDENEEAKRYDKVEYYIELKELSNIRTEFYNEDAFTQYMNYLSTIKEITKEEREQLLKEICDLKNSLKMRKLSYETINNRLRKLNINLNNYNKKSLKNKIKYIKSLKTNDNQIIIDILDFYELEEKIQQFMEYNLRLVIKIARMISLRRSSLGCLDINDIVQEGNIGLKRAINSFDYNKKCQFSTYAFLWIRQAINRAIDNNSRFIRIPVHTFEEFRNTCKVENELIYKLGKSPTEEELAKELGISIKKLRYIRKCGEEVVSLDTNISGDENEDTVLSDFVADANMDIDKIIDDVSDREQLNIIINNSNLTSREKIVMSFRFGLDFKDYVDFYDLKIALKDKYSLEQLNNIYKSFYYNGTPLSLNKVAKIFFISKSTIKQIETKILLKLRNKGKTRKKIKHKTILGG